MTKPKPVNTNQLCMELTALAGFIDNKSMRKKIYSAVRQLQLLDKLARDALDKDTKQ